MFFVHRNPGSRPLRAGASDEVALPTVAAMILEKDCGVNSRLCVFQLNVFLVHLVTGIGGHVWVYPPEKVLVQSG